MYIHVLAVELTYVTDIHSCLCRSHEGKLADLVLLFPRRSKSELRRTLERVGDDFDIAITAILEDDDMANSVLDPVAESKKGHNQGNEIHLTCKSVQQIVTASVLLQTSNQVHFKYVIFIVRKIVKPDG